MLWELGSRERIANRNFKIWDLSQCSVALQVCVELVDCIHTCLSFMVIWMVYKSHSYRFII